MTRNVPIGGRLDGFKNSILVVSGLKVAPGKRGLRPRSLVTDQELTSNSTLREDVVLTMLRFPPMLCWNSIVPRPSFECGT